MNIQAQLGCMEAGKPSETRDPGKVQFQLDTLLPRELESAGEAFSQITLKVQFISFLSTTYLNGYL